MSKMSNYIFESTLSPYVRVQRDTSRDAAHTPVSRATFLQLNIWLTLYLRFIGRDLRISSKYYDTFQIF